MATVADIVVGAEVRFTSISSHDINKYHGKVVGTGAYSLARGFSDVVGYNKQVQAQHGTIPEHDMLDYFLLELYSPVAGINEFAIAFAREWVSEPSIDIINTQEKVEVLIHDVNATDTNNIIGILRGAGYKASIIRVY